MRIVVCALVLLAFACPGHAQDARLKAKQRILQEKAKRLEREAKRLEKQAEKFKAEADAIDQQPPPGDLLERFLDMSPEERAAALRDLPLERRRSLLQRLRDLELLRLDEQRNLRGRLQTLARLTPARRQVVREELQRLRDMSREQRRARLSSPEFAAAYSADEQQLVREVFPNLNR
jgi:hypothetical protein